MTAAQPVSLQQLLRAASREVTSPEAITGTSTRSTSSAVERVVGHARVHLLGRAGMERERRRARLDQARADVERVARAVGQPAAHLHGDGHGHRAGHSADDLARPLRILEQRRAGAGLRHLAHGAAEVDVDDVGAGVLDHPGRLGHDGGLRAEDLHRQRGFVARDAEVAERALVAVAQARAAHHLRADEPGSEAPALAPEGLHADARHGREHDRASGSRPAPIRQGDRMSTAMARKS